VCVVLCFVGFFFVGWCVFIGCCVFVGRLTLIVCDLWFLICGLWFIVYCLYSHHPTSFVMTWGHICMNWKHTAVRTDDYWLIGYDND